MEEAQSVLHDALVTWAAKIPGQISGGCGGGLNGDDLFKALGECLGEETDAGVEIPCNGALALGDDRVQQAWDEVAVHLKECACAYLIMQRTNGVLDRWLTPSC